MRRASLFPKPVARWDVTVMRRLARSNPPVLIDRGLPLLTRCADRSILWLGLSALMTATGRTTLRRAAVRGTASIAVTSLVVNQVGKRVLVRARPARTATPAARLAMRFPTSNSFPSGHSASAVAFAVAVAAEAPPLAVPVGALAAAVAFSRIYTGVHFPSDVVVGAALGAGIAGLGLAVVPPTGPGPHRPGLEPACGQHPRPTGTGVVAVVNPDSGGGTGAKVIEELHRLLPDIEIVELAGDADPQTVFADAADRAEVLAVAGGDGTIRCAAEAAMKHERPLLVIPAGTFNHFARDLELSGVGHAVEALAAGRAIRIDVAEVNGQPFLNTASLGSYPEFVSIRERWESRIGKPLAATLATFTVARRCPPLEVEIDGVRRSLLMFFVGNGAYVPRGFVPRGRQRLDSAQLDVRLLDGRRGGSILGALAAALSADLLRHRGYLEVHEQSLSVRLLGQRGHLARDGEVCDAPTEVLFAIRPGALIVYRGVPRRIPRRPWRPAARCLAVAQHDWK
ncbi:MAG: phosphatase PAP2 family protein [Actinomycetota bacterium]|nr:phosphatase PAP2 family protein [Actinomycetota bacterium]